MLTNPTTDRRVAGRLAVLAAVAIALPLTATRAVEYVDKVVPAAPKLAAAMALAPAAAVADPAAPTEPAAPVAPAAVAAPEPGVAVEPAHAVHVDKDLIVMNGKKKRWSELTPEEKAEIRRSIAEARRELAEHRFDGAKVRVEIKKAMKEAKIDKEELQANLAEARAEIASAMAEIDANRVELRRSGVDPEQLKVSIRESMKGIENIDVEAIRRSALASVDTDQIERTVEQALRKAEAELDRIDALGDEDHN